MKEKKRRRAGLPTFYVSLEKKDIGRKGKREQMRRRKVSGGATKMQTTMD